MHVDAVIQKNVFRSIRIKNAKHLFSFVMSVRVPACFGAAPTGRIFMKFDVGRGELLQKSAQKLEIRLKWDNSIGNCTRKPKYVSTFFLCDSDRASSLICGNKMPARCNRGFYCRSYYLLNMFLAALCPSSGAQE